MTTLSQDFPMIFEPFFHRTSIAMALLDPRGVITASNPALQTLLGFSADELHGRHLFKFIDGEDSPSCRRLIHEMSTAPTLRKSLGLCWICKNGRILHGDLTLLSSEIKGGAVDGLIATIEDRSESKGAEERLAYVTNFDPLTGLANDLLFRDRLKLALCRSRREASMAAVLVFNLKRFKVFNDSFGLAVGDRLLQEVATRISCGIRQSDTVARLSGDKFALLIEGLSEMTGISPVLRKIREALGAPFFVEDQEVFPSTSVGIALFPADGDHAEELIRNAESAMYRAVEKGRNSYQYYTEGMNSQARHRLRLESALYRALERNEFEVYYQPQIDPASGAPLGVEALLRWNHPERGVVGPDEFIPLLEETGLIIAAGEWVLRSACAQCRTWQSEGFSGLRVAVNISARQFLEKNFVAVLQEILRETGLRADSLDLEITESVLMQESERLTGILGAIATLGIHISIDDFGTGYSSLAYLKRFPVNGLKIDRSFIQGIPENRDDMAIAFAILSLAGNLGLKVTAEGVETEAQLDMLTTWRCQQLQGYLFARPMPADRFPSWAREALATPGNYRPV
jgi:diguanylate cyclase (GGDEF)-like protein/PAS domain S-box-containing protein